MYLPDLKSMRIAKEFTLGEYVCTVCTDCVSNQRIDYKHVMFVRHASEQTPSFAVAAETNAMAEEGSAILDRMRSEGASPETLAASANLVGSHFLGGFPGGGHQNFGASDDWADLDKFTARALEVVAHHFSITARPVGRPVGTARAPATPRHRPSGDVAEDAPGTTRPWWQFWK